MTIEMSNSELYQIYKDIWNGFDDMHAIFACNPSYRSPDKAHAALDKLKKKLRIIDVIDMEPFLKYKLVSDGSIIVKLNGPTNSVSGQTAVVRVDDKIGVAMLLANTEQVSPV